MQMVAVLRRWVPGVVAVVVSAAVLVLSAHFAHPTAASALMFGFLAAGLGVTSAVQVLLAATEHLTPPPRLSDEPNRRSHRLLVSAGVPACLAVAAVAVATFPLPPALGLVIIGLLAAAGMSVRALIAVARLQTGAVAERDRVAARLAAQIPEAVLYIGRPDGGRYQVTEWLPVLLTTHQRVMIATRSEQAFEALRDLASERVFVALLPRQRDLDAIPDSVKMAYYPGSSALNTNLVSYRGMTHIYLGHGDSDKEISAHPSHRMYDHVFVSGEAARERYADAGLEMPTGSLVVVGRPMIAEVKRDVEGAVRTVVYAPTWQGYNRASTLSSLARGAWIVRALVASGVRVVFRPHPLSLASSHERALVEAIDAVLTADSPRHRTSGQTKADTAAEVLRVADALVTDVSSMLIEFLPWRRRIAMVTMAGVDVHRYPSAAVATQLDNDEDVRVWLAAASDPRQAEREFAQARYVAFTGTEHFARAVERIIGDRERARRAAGEGAAA